jgi:hypothetical protein
MPTSCPMQIDTSLHSRDLPEVMDWLGAKIGSPLKKRVEDLERRERENPLFRWYCRKAFSWEFALEEARRHRSLQGSFPRDSRFDVAYGFAAALQRVYRNLGEKGRNQLAGRLRGALKDQFGLRPLAYEIQVLTHLCRRGFDVKCMDLEGEAKYDFLAVQSDSRVEIECKTTTSDTGRRVHMSDVSQLGRYLWPAAKPI